MAGQISSKLPISMARLNSIALVSLFGPLDVGGLPSSVDYRLATNAHSKLAPQPHPQSLRRHLVLLLGIASGHYMLSV